MSLQIVVGVKRHNKPEVITWSDSSGGELSPEFVMFGDGKYDDIFLVDCEKLIVKVRTMPEKAVWVDAEEQK